MKKLWLLVAGIAIVSCKNEAPIDYALISGNITNADDKEMILYGTTDRSFKKHTIAINEDGSFIDTVKVAGQFFLYQAKNGTPLHLEAGDNVTINYDAKDFSKTLAISGKGSEISSYLVAKKNKERELTGKGTEVYKQEEVDYKKTFNGIKTAQKELLNADNGIDAVYKTKEERNIQYEYLGKLNRYKSYHAYYAKKKDFEPSTGFLSELNDIKFDSEEDFIFSSAYKGLVTNHYQNIVSELVKADEKLDRNIVMLTTCSAIENQTIKNALIFDAVKYPITRADNLKEFYAAFKAAGSTDEKNNTEIEKSYNSLIKLAKGSPSPKFVNYENNAGGTTSLDDLKGKYVYIDVWATWCGPCKREIPFLKEVEKKYHDKNIEFLSISIDKKKDHQAWKDMVKEKELGGIQVFADSDWKSQFVEDYLIKGIPKFILLDPQGNIVTANAPRPSDKKLVEMFKDLKI
jgi:thiol-disulfide isomerase/thioredoxin